VGEAGIRKQTPEHSSLFTLHSSLFSVIQVLLVEDSLTVREHLLYILNADPQIDVVGTAKDGQEAVKFVQRKIPSVIVMDINMPRMDGFEATRHIMQTHPIPIVLVSANWDPKEMTTSFKAIEAGAVAVLAKPRGFGDPDSKRLEQELVQQVKLMSEIKVVTRRARKLTPSPGTAAAKPSPASPSAFARPTGKVKLIAIGTSTGGPPVLQTILTELPKNLPVPIVIVQHIAKGFLEGMVDWLGKSTGFSVHIAAHSEPLQPGHAYFAPDGKHLEVTRDGRAFLNNDPPDSGLRPSATHLFRSVSRSYGKQAIGVILTGMGADGAAELKKMRDTGAITIAQDKASSLVHGMPGEAIKMGAAQYIQSPREVVETLKRLVK